MFVRLGNTAALGRSEGLEAGEGEALEGDRVTELSVPDGMDADEVFVSITRKLTDPEAGQGIWEVHSSSPPSWVESDVPGLEEKLAAHYGCEIGAPDDLEETHHTVNGPPGVGPAEEGD